MTISIVKQAENRIFEIKSMLLSQNISSTAPLKKEYNFEVTAQKGVDKCKIQVYFGKKGVKIILQGNTDSLLYREIDSVIFNKLPLTQTENDDLIEPDEYIGTDESGKGDIFGPLVIAAVYVNKDTANQLMRIGVKDSKEIKNGKIFNLANEIKNICDGSYTVLVLDPVEYNRQYNEYRNLNRLLDVSHSSVIEELLERLNPGTIITDQFCKNPLSVSKNPLYRDKKFLQFAKGERYIGVAAASILARDAFEQWFTTKESEGIALPKGASNEVIRFLKQVIKSYGRDEFVRLTKNHFTPVRDLLIK